MALRWLCGVLCVVLLLPAGRHAFAADGVRLMSAGEVYRAQRQGRVHLVDPRPPAHFERAHIPGAISLSPVELKTQDHWKDETVVLVGSGAAYGALTALGEALLASGFRDVGILDGGTRHWLAQSEPRRKANPFAVITPAEIDLARDADRWIVIDTTSGAPALPPGVAHIRGVEAPAITGRLGQIGERIRVVPNILVVADSMDAASALADLLHTTRGNAYVLAGGWRDYAAHQRALRSARHAPSSEQTNAGVCW